MREVKSKSKSEAVLMNLTDLCLVLGNNTSWSSKITKLRRFADINDELVKDSHAYAAFHGNDSNAFYNKIKKCYLMLCKSMLSERHRKKTKYVSKLPK